MSVGGTIFFSFLCTVVVGALVWHGPRMRVPARIKAKRARKSFRYVRGGKVL